jgi:hypothetical protein
VCGRFAEGGPVTPPDTGGANFQAPVTTLNNPNFGRILAANPGRQIQLAMKVIW